MYQAASTVLKWAPRLMEGHDTTRMEICETGSGDWTARRGDKTGTQMEDDRGDKGPEKEGREDEGPVEEGEEEANDQASHKLQDQEGQSQSKRGTGTVEQLLDPIKELKKKDARLWRVMD